MGLFVFFVFFGGEGGCLFFVCLFLCLFVAVVVVLGFGLSCFGVLLLLLLLLLLFCLFFVFVFAFVFLFVCFLVCESKSSFTHRLVGLVIKASASRAEDPGFESRFRQDFSGVETYQ